jgi:Holliday junction resolvase RusA-like endonuclease
MIHMLLPGPIVPYTRMTQGSLWTERSRRYLASQTALRLQMQAEMARNGWTMFPAMTLLRLHVVFGWCMHTHDLSNILKACEDAANGVIWADDRWIDEIVTRRESWDKPGLALWVGPLPPADGPAWVTVAHSDHTQGGVA